MYLDEREVKRVGYIVVSTDRGLCGGLNANLFKKVVAELGTHHGNGVEVDLAVIGSKALGFFRSFGGNVVATAGQVGDQPIVADLIGSVKVMMDAYEDGKIDHLYVVYNHFVNTMAQNPTVQQLLPLPKISRMTCLQRWAHIGTTSTSLTLVRSWMPSLFVILNHLFISRW